MQSSQQCGLAWLLLLSNKDPHALERLAVVLAQLVSNQDSPFAHSIGTDRECAIPLPSIRIEKSLTVDWAKDF